jgi:hypothetical protein
MGLLLWIRVGYQVPQRNAIESVAATNQSRMRSLSRRIEVLVMTTEKQGLP